MSIKKKIDKEMLSMRTMKERFDHINKKKELDFNGGWSPGEAAHHIGKKMKEQVVKDKTKYNRKKKHKNQDED
tara:strand:+ start:265 stop:483 length:219 start_codon:yes stop_codon:yes gene_type:complete